MIDFLLENPKTLANLFNTIKLFLNITTNITNYFSKKVKRKSNTEIEHTYLIFKYIKLIFRINQFLNMFV
jgi:hypothetical protein